MQVHTIDFHKPYGHPCSLADKWGSVARIGESRGSLGDPKPGMAKGKARQAGLPLAALAEPRG